MELKCELKSVQSKAYASGDMVYKLVLLTENPMAMDLGKLPFNTLFYVKIGVENNEVNGQ